MRRYLRFWINCLIFLIPMLILGIGAVRFVRGLFGYLNSDARLAGTLSAEATRALNREVRIGDVKITGNLWGLSAPNRIDLRDVYVAEDPRFLSEEDRAAGRRFGHADSVSIWYNLRQIIGTGDQTVPLVNEVRVVGPEVALARNAAGKWNFADLIKPQAHVGRPFADKVSFVDGALYYADMAFPHPPGVPPRPLRTRLDRLAGVVLIRPDKRVAFDVSGAGPPETLRDFHAIGLLDPKPLRVQVHVAANRLNLPFLSQRFIAPTTASLRSGQADLNVTAVYAPPQGLPYNVVDLGALDLFGDVRLFQVTGASPEMGAPLENLNGTATLTSDSVLTDLSGRYAGADIRVSGSVLGALRRIPGPRGTTRIVLNLRPSGPGVPPASLALQGSVQHGDFGHIARLLKLEQRFALPADVRTELRQVNTRGQADFQVAGPVDNPMATVEAHLDTARYQSYRGDGIDLRALYANRSIQTDIRATYAGGKVAIRAQVGLDPTGAFQAEAHGRGLHLDALGTGLKTPLQGTGQLDLSIQGQRGRTPSITAQAQIDNVAINHQTLHSVYARAETVGRDLVLRTFRAEDVKGFALASGTMSLTTQKLNLNLEADNLDVGALAKAFPLPASIVKPPGAKTAGNANAPPAPPPVEGVGYLRGQVTGTLRDPQVSGRLNLFALQVGQDPANKFLVDRAGTDFTISRSAVDLRNGTLQHYPGRLSFSGTVRNPLAKEPDLYFVVTTDPKSRWDVADLMSLAGMNTQALLVTGLVTTSDIVVEGTPSALRIPAPFTVSLRGASINGMPLQTVTATIGYQDKTVLLRALDVQAADGTLTASGSVQTDGALNVDLHGSKFDLEKLAGFLPGDVPVTVKGLLNNLQAHVEGTLKEPVATATVDTLDVAVNGVGIGDLQGTAHYADKRVALQNVTLSDVDDPTAAGGKMVIPSLAYDTETRAVQGSVQVQNVPIAWVRELFQGSAYATTETGQAAMSVLQQIVGPFSGTATIGGTLDKPRAEIAWNTTGLSVDTYQVTQFNGKATVTPQGVSNGQAQLAFRPISPAAAPTATAATPAAAAQALANPESTVVVNKLDFALDGDVDADVNVYNVDFAVLEHFLPPGRSLPINGMIDTVGVTARGPSKSPDVDISVSLRNLSYGVRPGVPVVATPLPAHSPPVALVPPPPGPTIVTIDRVDVAQIQIRAPRVANGQVVETGRIEADDIRLTKDEKVGSDTHHYIARASGTITGFEWKSPFIPSDAQLQLQAGIAPQDASDQNLRILSVFAPGLLATQTQGQITVTANVTGTRAHPKVQGGLNVTAPRVQLSGFATGLRDLKADIALDNDRLVVNQFAAQSQVYQAQRGGLLNLSPRLTGSPITLTGALPLGFDASAVPVTGGLTLHADRFLFDESPLPGAKGGRARGEAVVNVQVAGSVATPTVTGNLLVQNTDATLPSDFVGGVGGGLNLPIRPSFDLMTRLGKNVRLRNVALDATIGGYAHLTGRVIEADQGTPTASQRLDVHLDGLLTLDKGYVTLPTARFKINPGGTITLLYPVYQGGEPSLAVTVNDLKAQTALTATSVSGVRRRYQVTVTANGPLIGGGQSRFTNGSGLNLQFQTDPNDLANSQQELTQRLAGALIGADTFNQFGQNPGQAFAATLTNVLTNSVLPTGFQRLAQSLGFEELALNYDPIQRLTLTISREIFPVGKNAAFYVTYIRSLNANQQTDIQNVGAPRAYDLKLSLRFLDRYQLSYDVDDQHTNRLLLEGVWRF